MIFYVNYFLPNKDICKAAAYTNAAPIPDIPSSLGIHLPTGKHRLTEENYHIDVERMVCIHGYLPI